MELTHLNLDQLSVSRLNMRHGANAPDVSDILPSVRARGILMPLLVRPNGSEETFEIVAGRRRYFAARALVAEGLPLGALPCAILAVGDDADALEASLIENLARQDPDEVTQWVSFVRLVKTGRSVEDIALTFGVSEQKVKRILALGNLLPAIRALYRLGEIDAATVRHLTLASRARQQEWLTLWRDPECSAPTGRNLKSWLFGGQSVATTVAIFPLEEYPGEIVTDLFGEERYFADSNLFWQHQTQAVDALAKRFEGQGWKEVHILQPGAYFNRWEYDRADRDDGGHVHIAVAHSGEVEVHEGWRTRRTLHRSSEEKATEAPERPEFSAPLRNYVALHRHAAVRAKLAERPDLTLRLMLAHMICNAGHWNVRPDPLHAHKPEILQSVTDSPAAKSFSEAVHDACEHLGTGNGDIILRSRAYDAVSEVLETLMALPDETIVRIATIAMAESLEAGSRLIDALGIRLEVDLAGQWSADGIFFDLLRNREVVEAIVGEVAGEATRTGHAGTSLKLQKAIVHDCLEGRNGRQKVESWTPRWLRFPAESYVKTDEHS